MYRTHTCGELRIDQVGQEVSLAGWVQRVRELGGMVFVDLRDRYGITQLVFNNETNSDLCQQAKSLGREFVVQAKGTLAERASKNAQMDTGDIEINVGELNVLNAANTPPFTIEDETDGGEDIRMKYRYLDLRRPNVQNNIILRHRIAQEARKYLNNQNFLEIETPFLIKSTPEGARDFVVPSRMNEKQFYALPQSPQTFKQLLMVAGYDRYYQIVRCFRDEDLRADRQPEFTQIDCEMAFVEQEDILNNFEGMMKHIVKYVHNIDIKEAFPRMTWDDAMRLYGSDKPDIRFGMTFVELNDESQNKGFKVFDEAELVVGICVPGAASYSRKQLDALTDFVKRPQVGAKGLVYVKCNEDGSYKSSVDKFFDGDALGAWADKMEAKPGDLILIISGESEKARTQLNVLRLHMGDQLGLRKKGDFKFLWVVDFPLLEWAEEEERWVARHHPFTSPKLEDFAKMDTDPGAVRANAYDMILNGTELGGGSVRIHDRALQQRVFELLGMDAEEYNEKFGFLMGAFEYGAPPHAGLAFGFDRMCSLLGGADAIRDFIAFPKNNSGRDVMINAPSFIDGKQYEELHIKPV
ncbi:UNVERIFIED_CONTAM: hypothetical protein GTU68_007321 [Idotea baltica]|nr:hypothetical protein [Idotea baltica]